MKKITAIVLAAGSSSRFGDANKLLTNLEGRPMLEHVLTAIRKSSFRDIKAVMNEQYDEICDLCERLNIDRVFNARAHLGMGSSIAAGVSAMNTGADGVMIALGDMPFIKEESYRALFDAFSTAPKGSIVAPEYEGVRGHPVIFDAAYLPILKMLNNDQGARAVIKAHREKIIIVPVDDPGVLKDVDHPGDLS